jgi:ubiquinone/menaquinone biosynthesis C-methylase UbiE
MSAGDLMEVLACPACSAPLGEPGDDAPRCPKCGAPAPWRYTLGIPDFLGGRDRLVGALGGELDLERDADVAGRLAAEEERLDFRSLVDLRRQIDPVDGEEHVSHVAERARRRFDERYTAVEAEVGLHAGDGIVTKVGAYLDEAGLAPLQGTWGLEAGSGPGLHLVGFARRFRRVIVLDALLANLVLARRLARDCGIEDAYFVRANVEELPIRSGVLAFVHENGVIEHVADPERMIREALRTLAPGGTYVCLSPNRYSIAPEPHFRLPLFGAFPSRIRRPLVLRARGLETEAGTDLRSLRQLRRHFAAVGERPGIFFLPPRIDGTVRKTPVRRLVSRLMATPGARAAVTTVANRALLGVMPYHVAVVQRPPGEASRGG